MRLQAKIIYPDDYLFVVQICNNRFIFFTRYCLLITLNADGVRPLYFLNTVEK